MRIRTPPKKKRSPARPVSTNASVADEVEAALTWLKRKSTKRDRENMPRFGIVARKALGVSMVNVRLLADRLGRNHELAASLWDTGWYEARILASLVDEPARVTPTQMDRWCRDFDNWGICDTVCFHLFDRTPHAWGKIAQWSVRRDEFVKRAAFALMASLALHDKRAGDEPFVRGLRFVERAAGDERNFVKKSVSWALRAVGERNLALNAAATTVARRLADSKDATSRWVGKGALREFARPAVLRRLAARSVQ